jgi:uncharacterized protein (TIGR02611 family)
VPASRRHPTHRLVLHGVLAVAEVVLGLVLLVAGLVMLVTPGPGLLAIFGGLALLGRHVPWLRRWLHGVKQRVEERLDERRHGRGDSPRAKR